MFGLMLAFMAGPIPNHTNSVYADTHSAGDTQLPVGETVFKIEIDEEGIYEVSASTLRNLGMSPSLNPANIQVLHNGNPIAWELVSDSSGQAAVFDQNDKIRFYGWPFDESRAERLFVNSNIFWIVPGVPAESVEPAAGGPPSTPVVKSVTTTTQLEIDDHFSSMFMVESDWANEGAEPDHYFWTTISRSFGDEVVTKTIAIDLPHPTNSATPATIEAVSAARAAGNTPGRASMILPDGGQVDYDFYLGDIFSLTDSLPNNMLSNGANTITFQHSQLGDSDSAGNFYVNYLNVTYQQDLKATDNFLSFSHSSTGATTFELSGFSASAANDLTIWNISDRHNPTALTASSAGSGAYRFNETGNGVTDFAIASSSGIKTVATSAVSAYTVKNLEPAAGYADWLAISYGGFIDIGSTTDDVNGLAAHRANYSNLTTQVVDIEDVVNQYGFGFPTSHAVKAFITHAYQDWDQPVRYVLLVGDGHYNPRHLACSTCSAGGANFQTTADSLIPIHHSYTDPNQGLIPSDYRYSLLTGDDLISEIGIGRITAETPQQVQDAVGKIIAYEDNLLQDLDWAENMLFAHDWPDRVPSNFFRVESERAQDKARSHGFSPTVAGLNTKPADVDDPAAIALRQTISEAAAEGISLLVWRGHGSINNWSGGDVMSTEKILNNQLLPNLDKPFISITHNCLDGNFAYPGWEGLGETLVNLGENSTGAAINRHAGSAAHFSATGLGYIEEHEVIADYLFEALFDKGLTTFGDAINYAKVKYLSAVPSDPNVSIAQLYNYNLLGDPAMEVFNAELTSITGDSSLSSYEPGDDAEFTFELSNLSEFTSSANGELNFVLPKDFTYLGTLVDYTGPNSDDFDFPNSPGLEPNTLAETAQTNGNTEVSISLKKLFEDEKLSYGGIPAEGAIKIRIYGRVVEQPSKSFWTLPYTFTAPGGVAQSGSLVIDLGGAKSVFLPFVIK